VDPASSMAANSDPVDHSASSTVPKLSPAQQSPPKALDHDILQKALNLLKEKEQATIREFITADICRLDAT
jgi:hypothetical protein